MAASRLLLWYARRVCLDPGRWHAPLLAFRRAGKQTWCYKAAGGKKK